MEMPEAIANLPRDEQRGLPIPYMNQRGDGTHSFTAIFAPTVLRCAQESLCGICGTALSYASAFVGGPLSAQSRIYTDPPFHPQCAKFAMTVCPHIVIPHAKRATERRREAESGETVSHGIEDKPQEWVIGIAPTRETRVEFRKDGVWIFAGRWTRTIRYSYIDGKLVQQ